MRTRTGLPDETSEELARHATRIRRRLAGHGTTFETEDGSVSRWQLDPLPFVVDRVDWERIARGVEQRARLLDAVLADLYGPQRLLHQGLVPVDAVLAHPSYLRPALGIRPPGGRHLVTAAVDVARVGGVDVVLSDRTETPAGAGYVLENRDVLSGTYPEHMGRMGVGRLAEWFTTYRAALAALAPAGVEDPRVVMLTPGPAHETYFEHAYLARTLGFTLVEPADLAVREGRVWLKAVSGREPVHVVVRLVPAEWCDPLELRADSTLGIPGLVEATRRGTVSVVNPLGSGLAENQALLPVVDDLVRTVLGEEPLLPTCPTWWCGDDRSRAHVLAHLERLVVKPIARVGGRPSVFGRLLNRSAREELAARITARPHAFVAQEEQPLDTAPSFDGTAVVERHLVVRTFLVADGDGYRAMDGGLARAADRPERVAMSSGAVSKDTWVLGPPTTPSRSHRPARLPQVDLRSSVTSRAAESMFWVGRNLERAEVVLRAVRAVERQVEHWPDLVDEADGAWMAATRSMVAALSGGAAELSDAVRDRTRTRTVATSLHFLVQGARSVRELFSTDSWRVLSDLAEIEERLARSDEDEVLDVAFAALVPLTALSGLVMESMVRDPGWRFLDIGRRIERALLVVDTLRATMAVPLPPLVLPPLHETVLTSWDSLVAYRRRHRSDIEPAALVALLVEDPSNPRSIRFQLDRLATDVASLPALGDRFPGGTGLVDDLRRRLVRPGALDELLSDLDAELRRFAKQLELAYFAHVQAVAVR